ncbi:pentatricopeptide repeat-containing protein At5g03800 [Phoenix dactylifera]|uniref:Pentatricopeptide repeat-containing protein At5g03800 n=1 Tax=Phoenix dactylifera TaxID=42345 RepID=A0A8B7CS87_PHODC|nr:pentatricopeptide repeat-containing protein At5g03800 [Phoenix dactylifera]
MATAISTASISFTPLSPFSRRKPTFHPHHSSLPLRPSSLSSLIQPNKTPNLSLSPLPLLPPPLDSTQILELGPLHDDRRLRHLLRLAADHRDLALGRAVHAAVAKAGDGADDDTRLANALIFMYLKLGRLADARKAFECLPCPDVASFTALVSGYAKCGCEAEAIDLFCRMRQSGIDPNEFSFVAILTDCIRQGNSQLGAQVHALAIKTHHCFCVHVSNALVGMYVKCGRVDAAVQLFGDMPERDVSSWNAVILGMVEDCRYHEAFELFHDMQISGYHGDHFTLSTLLSAAAESFAHAEGEAIHAYALKTGLELELSICNALIGFYSKFGRVEDVVDVFQRMPVRDVISWTGMLTGFMEFGLVDSAVEVFDQMPERNSISYNALLAGFCKNSEGYRGLKLFQQILEDGMEMADIMLTGAINACAIVSDRKPSEQIHAFVIKIGCESNHWIKTALIDMCSKCGRMEDAQKMFGTSVHHRSFPMAWTSLICAHAKNGQPEEAIALFHEMLKRDGTIKMDEFMSATVLGVCGTLGFGVLGKQIHCSVAKSGISSDLAVENAIFSMYAKCGDLADAITFFDQMPRHDIVSWNALITAHLLHRQGDRALDVWANMVDLGVKPDSITFNLIFSACKYTSTNSVSTCQRLFHSMGRAYDVEPASEHYAAMVDVLGFWGSFDEAERLINSMPFKADASIWRALLDNCRLRSNLSLGKQVAQRLLALEPQDPSTYILVSNLYSAFGRWHCSEKVRNEMRGKGFRKHPARSWTIHQNAVHSFFARDRSHPQTKDIYGGLDILILECMKAGYEPDTSFVLHEVEEYQKKHFLFYHSAKLAAMYGILMTGRGRPVRIVKNIRLCGDCHAFMNYVSTVTGREISVRDATGFHNFKGGKCSCGDSW